MSPKVGMGPLRREQIVRATIRCLARDGYAGLTLKNVARAAGVSPGILHYYFPDKRAILVAALQAVMTDLDRRIAVAQAHGGRRPRACLRALIRACLATAVEERELWVVFIEFWGEMMHDSKLRAVNAALYTRMRRSIAAVVTQGVRAGDFRRADTGQAAAVILGLLDGVSLQLTFDPAAFTVTDAARFCEDAVERYLAQVEQRPASYDGSGVRSLPRRQKKGERDAS